MVRDNGVLKFTPTAEFLQKSLDNAVFQIQSGDFDYNRVIIDTVRTITDSGLRTIDYASGKTEKIDVAVRRAVVTGMNQVVAKVSDYNAEQLDTDYFEVSAHLNARPSHQKWQGKVYSRDELEKVCGLGDMLGLCGINCYHNYWAFIPGVSVRAYTDEELQEMANQTNKKRTYGGKQYTGYEATQEQRRLERAIRKQRQRVKLLEEGHASEDEIILTKAKNQALSQQYADFSKKMGLPEQRERIRYDGLDANKSNLNNLKNSQYYGKLNERADRKLTIITDLSINKVKIDHIYGMNQEQVERVVHYSKELLKDARLNNNNFETAYFLNKNADFISKKYGDEFGIEFTNVYQMGLTLIHNHPRNSSYSDVDLDFFTSNDNINNMLIIKNNGNVEILSKTDKFNENMAKVFYNRITRNYKDRGQDVIIIKYLEKMKKEGALEWLTSFT